MWGDATTTPTLAVKVQQSAFPEGPWTDVASWAITQLTDEGDAFKAQTTVVARYLRIVVDPGAVAWGNGFDITTQLLGDL